jgi:thiol-disulfide isomerase/thioredoxin
LLDDLRCDRRALQTFAGNVVLVHFFATWCESCVRESTSLQKLTDILPSKPLAIDVTEVDLRVRGLTGYPNETHRDLYNYNDNLCCKAARFPHRSYSADASGSR